MPPRVRVKTPSGLTRTTTKQVITHNRTHQHGSALLLDKHSATRASSETCFKAESHCMHALVTLFSSSPAFSRYITHKVSKLILRFELSFGRTWTSSHDLQSASSLSFSTILRHVVGLPTLSLPSDLHVKAVTQWCCIGIDHFRICSSCFLRWQRTQFVQC